MIFIVLLMALCRNKKQPLFEERNEKGREIYLENLHRTLPRPDKDT